MILLPQSRGFDDGVLYLGVPDDGVVSDARVGADYVSGPISQCGLIMAGPRIVIQLRMMVPPPTPTLLVRLCLPPGRRDCGVLAPSV